MRSAPALLFLLVLLLPGVLRPNAATARLVVEVGVCSSRSVGLSRPAGSPLSYAVASSDEGVAAAAYAGADVTVCGMRAGTAAVTVTACAPSTGRCSEETFTVVVREGKGALAGPTFSERLNPTGDPLGGGPGYTGAWRAARGLAGPGVCTEADGDHVVTTEAELQAVARTYTLRSDGRTRAGASPAAPGQIVFVRGDGRRELLLNEGLDYDFVSGVTVCSDLGRDNGDGTYAWGTRVYTTEGWGAGDGLDFQVNALFTMTRGWRLTGLRIEGPSTWGLVHNVNQTSNWMGESYGVRVNTGSYAERPEIDNVWIDGFSYMGINLYRGHALAHHFRVLHARRQGYGYGVYPGRVIDGGDTTLTEQEVVGWIIHETRHATDGSLIGVNADGTTKGYNALTFRSGIVSGHSRAALLNTHGGGSDGTPGASYGSYRAAYERIAFFDDDRVPDFNLIAGWPTGGPDGYLRVSNLWSRRSDVLDKMRLGGSTYGLTFAEIRGGAPRPAIGGDRIDIDFDTIYPSGEGMRRPVLACALQDDAITEGGTVTLTLAAVDPQGHAMRWYEVRWGDGADVRASTERFYPSETPTHTYARPGVYVVRVDGFNEHGVFGTQTLPVYVSPADVSTPKWTFRVAPSFHPHFAGPQGAGFPGYYEGRVVVNGVTVYAFDLLDAANAGWRDVVVDAAASLAGATAFDLDLEVALLRDVPDPQTARGAQADGTHPGVAAMRVDNLWLWGDDGLRADGAAWARMDPLFDAPRSRHGVEYDWNAQSGARVHGYDTPSDTGGILTLGTSTTTAGTVGKYDLQRRPYLYPPAGVAVTRGRGGAVVVGWDPEGDDAIRVGVRIRVYRQSDGALLHAAEGEADDGRYPVPASGSYPAVYVRVEAEAPHWNDPGTTVYSRYSEAYERP